MIGGVLADNGGLVKTVALLRNPDIPALEWVYRRVDPFFGDFDARNDLAGFGTYTGDIGAYELRGAIDQPRVSVTVANEDETEQDPIAPDEGEGEGEGDHLIGGGGEDRFLFRKNGGDEVIVEFEDGVGLIRVQNAPKTSFAALTRAQDGADALVIFYGGFVRLGSIDVAALSED
ncbi:MAG: hypothetical protein AAF360_20240 [Pseudomonadota bacterium]